ncbi:hypothetical protein OUZ56_003313 [Daphnia magna]|uniref:Uncharacterized protein n=1 Tax=Daphnia magna TaxID=35525 RepID=A0ABR0A8D3_9CRUS|nr:hypothetical protein OUZ56_003313 [Daphnia magna]
MPVQRDRPNTEELEMKENSKHRKTTEKVSIKKPKAKAVPVDIPTSVQAQRHHVKECRIEVEKIMNATQTSPLSFRMRTCPIEKQLKEGERDTNTALLSFAINSGLGRFSDAEPLHSIFDLMKDPEYNSSVVVDEFKGLVVKIDSEIVLADTERIVRQHNIGVNKNVQYLPEVIGSLREPHAKTPFLQFSQCYNFHLNERVGKNPMKKSLESREDLMQMTSFWLLFWSKQLGLRRRKTAQKKSYILFRKFLPQIESFLFQFLQMMNDELNRVCNFFNFEIVMGFFTFRRGEYSLKFQTKIIQTLQKLLTPNTKKIGCLQKQCQCVTVIDAVCKGMHWNSFRNHRIRTTNAKIGSIILGDVVVLDEFGIQIYLPEVFGSLREPYAKTPKTQITGTLTSITGLSANETFPKKIPNLFFELFGSLNHHSSSALQYGLNSLLSYGTSYVF